MPLARKRVPSACLLLLLLVAGCADSLSCGPRCEMADLEEALERVDTAGTVGERAAIQAQDAAARGVKSQRRSRSAWRRLGAASQ